MKNNRGYTLVELIVAVGLFTIVMTLTSGVYLLMIGLNQRAQGMATGIDNLSFALETMTRNIRTGTNYSCGANLDLGDCPADGNTAFTFVPSSGDVPEITYELGSESITSNGVSLTDPSVKITSLVFYVSGSSSSDTVQPHVTILVSGSVSLPGKPSQDFTVETGATMRGTDI